MTRKTAHTHPRTPDRGRKSVRFRAMRQIGPSLTNPTNHERPKMTETRPPSTIKCPRCPAEWGGLNTAHCPSCHETFTTVSAFDKHRAGKYADDTRHCVDPATVGLVKANRAYPCWAHAGTRPSRVVNA